MEVLLLSDILGVGKKNDLIVVASGYALNNLLPLRKALVVTPNVRRQYAEEIKHRAMERDAERQLQMSLANALGNKIIHISANAAKTGKLYASVSESALSDAIRAEYALDIPASSISMKEHIKTPGLHTISIVLGSQKTSVSVEVKAASQKATVKLAA